MKNILKKLLILILAFANILMLILIFVPIIYDQEIKNFIHKTASKHINGHVFYDDFSLNLFSDFPNISLAINEFGIVGEGVFQNDTLLKVNTFEIVPNLWSVIAGDQTHVKGILVDGLKLNVKVLKNGKTNYDIAKSQKTDNNTKSSSSLKLNLAYWSITNSQIKYQDEGMQLSVLMDDINHEGGGEFVANIFDFQGNLTAEKLNVDFENINYLSNKKLVIDAGLAIDLDQFKFTFKENHAKLNAFKFNFDGFFQMLESHYAIDINFGAENTKFKTLLSLVPDKFKTDLNGLKTHGDVEFDGFVKGKYSDTEMPAFRVKLSTENAMLKYPKLPMAVENINLKLLINNPDGNLENTITDIQKFSMNLGKNPVQGKLKIKGLNNYEVNGKVYAKLNLEEMMQVLPLDSITLKGMYELNLTLDGTYDKKKKIIPKIDAKMNLINGYAKSEAYPVPIENITLVSSITNTSGKWSDTNIALSKLSLQADGQPFTMKGSFHNLDNVHYNVDIDGTIDLEKITKVFPLDSMRLKGIVQANIQTSGTQKDAIEKRFSRLPTNGHISLKNFILKRANMPQTIKINHALLAFTPSKLLLKKYHGFLGKSDVNLSGEIHNYIAYILEENAVLKGDLELSSQKFDANEWITKEDTSQKDTTSLTVIEIPKMIDLRFKADINQVNYQNMTLTQAKGMVLAKNGVMKLDHFTFDMLGGKFGINGTYDPKNTESPKFDLGFNIKNLNFRESAKAFNTIRIFAPITEKIQGTFSTRFDVKGVLGTNMMPRPESLTGDGILQILDADLKNISLLDKISTVSKIPNLNQYRLKDFDLNFAFKAGRLLIDTFDVKLGNYKAKVAGSAGHDQTTDFAIQLNVPKDKIARQLSASLDRLTEGQQSTQKHIELDLKVVGKFSHPRVLLVGSNTKNQIRKDITNKLKKEGKRAKDSAINFVKDIFTDTTTAPKDKVRDAVNKLRDKLPWKKKKD